MMPEFKQLAMAKGLRIYATIPRLREGDIEITVEGDMLHIIGKQSGNLGTFEADIQIPSGFDSAYARAEYFSGELRIVLPRRYDS